MVVKSVYAVVFAVIYYRFFYRKWQLQGVSKLVLNTLMYVYGCLVLFVTLIPIPFPFPMRIANLWPLGRVLSYGNITPFNDLILGRAGAMRDIVLNVIMMLPFGFLLPLVTQRIGWVKVFLAGLTFSLAIEIIQLLYTALWAGNRSFDVTDLIANTAGALIGYGLFRFLAAVAKLLGLKTRRSA